MYNRLSSMLYDFCNPVIYEEDTEELDHSQKTVIN